MIFLGNGFIFAQGAENCVATCQDTDTTCMSEATTPTEWYACGTELTTCNTACNATPATCADFYDIDQSNWGCQSGYEAIADTTIDWQTLNCCSSIDATTNSTVTTSGSPAASKAYLGIDCDQTKLVNGQCKLNIYDTLGIRSSVRNPNDPTSVWLFVQDIVLSATFFIGTIVTIALIVSGLMFIFAGINGKDPTTAKKWITWSLIGLIVVACSYFIIRLIQYLAKGF